jgi:XisI protein
MAKDMDKVTFYKSTVRTLMEHFAEMDAPEQDGLKTYLISDDQHGHYLLMTIGWHDNHRTYFPYLHIDVNNDKVYVEKNMSEISIAKVLEEKGIPKEDIILAFHAPFKLPYTRYAVS